MSKYPEEYPEMTVEKRKVNNLHGLKKPVGTKTKAFQLMMADTLLLADDCKHKSFSPKCLDILLKYSPVEIEKRKARKLLYDFGFSSWQSICDFVRDDECPEFACKMFRYVKNQGHKRKNKKDFIDGAGTGDYLKYLRNLKKTLEKTFDVKFTVKRKRPLELLYESTGSDFSFISDYIHPGHYEFPAGHADKFYTAVATAIEIYDIPEQAQTELVFIAYAAAMGRSGILVHVPDSNIASGALTGLDPVKFGFDKYLEK